MIQLHFEFMVGVHDDATHVPNSLKIAKGQLDLLESLLAKSDRVCTLDDATRDLAESFDDGGKWRGSITLELYRDGVISQAGAENSKRPSRNRGLLRSWRLEDERKAKQLIESLRRFIEAKENPPTAATVRGSNTTTTTPTQKESKHAAI